MTESDRTVTPGHRGRVFYYFAAVLAVLILPDIIRYRAPFVVQDHAAQAPLLALAFVGAVVLARTAGKRRMWRFAVAIGVLLVAALGVVAVTRYLPEVAVSRTSALVSLALSGALIVTGEVLSSSILLPVAGVALLVAAIGAPVLSIYESSHDPPSTRNLHTTYEAITVTPHGQVVEGTDVHKGGAIKLVGDRVVAMTGAGALYLLDHDSEDGPVRGTRLPIGRPVDFSEFPPELVIPTVSETVRATGLITRQTEEGWQFFVSHHVWHEAERCVTLQISVATLGPELDRVVKEWRKVTETKPCLVTGADDPAPVFDGLLSGGRMQWFSENELLLTVGDHGWDMLARPVAAAQLDDWDYGKIRVVDVTTGEIRPFAKGNRNPQGLLITDDGTIWSTEHGPRGGDELNLIVEGANYGWPFETYGTNYGEFRWGPEALRPAEDAEAYTAPRHSWLPSAGISALIQVRSDLFPSWKGDLLIGSMAKATLFRVHLEGDRVAYAEAIAVGEQIRDLAETPDGDIWLWTDLGTVATVRPSVAGRTELAIMECARCHALRLGDPPLATAPSLAGIVNRRVASDRNYRYTEALRSLGGNWTRDRLSQFLENPQAYAPGTAMPYFGFESQEALDSLTAYLGRL